MVKKYGIVAIVGKPNVGKSTLINAIMRKKVSIISNKPQTTRNAIKEIYEDDDSAIIFTDTPGFHEPSNKLDLFLNHEIEVSYKEANVILFVSSMDKELSEDDFEIINLIKESNKENVILVISKAEVAKNQDKIDERVHQLNKYIQFKDVIQISALHVINIDKLINTIKQYLHKDVVTDYFRQKVEKEDKFIIAETIREQCLLNLNHEVPHGVGVEIDESKYNQEANHWIIKASIIIEKNSHKPIVIGQNGAMIKKISMAARKQLHEIYDCHISLTIFVKVENNWRENNNVVKSLGYKIKK
ncbi:GTPase Era [Ureaplasma urealyticum]|uniref:GTPase Era n=5 Tax=Ureaplasma urealyticum TaxID=2130 RepID=ERA_UREU1|nr:GTPase Era [Ureaplasma urealyticum]B5ZBZ8.1 RecName: Full=GTPase Era [Ureaplasma urealyticum serovar 10 str. ATCC 33699]EDX53617.1 GTP-binding protein Era [Ureaplasma urealyticum serovar 9 str. ATCC 33175]ACI59962.1 GTP-binding protein Era [Ureaplasma urealyticum serovar 10 str. ATCC 33699]EDU06158.1 GTP-binding protein Era [Ureaplasma urealyticum serovar 5 str. ATCC 27817]EDU57122.1 GTP-binding protein Era [Ureaplasma urealyticum serovar 7 str. ATCC 27819]EDU67240.1 GTP-binding protein Er